MAKFFNFWKNWLCRDSSFKSWSVFLFPNVVVQLIYPFFHNHGSRKLSQMKGNYYWSHPLFTSMIMGGRVMYCIRISFFFKRSEPVAISSEYRVFWTDSAHVSFMTWVPASLWKTTLLPASKWIHPRKLTAKAPEKWWLEDEFPFGALPIFRGYVRFPGV